MSQVDDFLHKPVDVDTYEILNSKGTKVWIGVTKDFREECWYLWFMDPDTGYTIRT